MRTEHYQRDDGEWMTEVVLSRRNIMALLAKLDGHPPDSGCKLRGPSLYPDTIVRAEEDEVHYAHESRRGWHPGRMHPDTEAAVRARVEAARGARVQVARTRRFLRGIAHRDFS